MDCAICWEEFENSAFSLYCGHIFHRECIEKMAGARMGAVACPLCRKVGSPRISGLAVREIFFTSATRASSAGPATETHTQRALQQALQDSALAAANLAGARADIESYRALACDLQRKDTERERELQEGREREAAVRRERDDALALVARIQAEREALDARVAALERQKGEIEGKIGQYAKLEESLKSTMELFRKMSDGDRDGQTKAAQTTGNGASGSRVEGSGSSGSSTTTIKTEPGNISLNQTPPIVYAEINVESRQARTAHKRDAPALRAAPVTEEGPPPAPTPAAPKKRQLKTGSAILGRGYGVPKRTAVLECVARDGYHVFSGKGTNQYKERYTCKVAGCGVVVSE